MTTTYLSPHFTAAELVATRTGLPNSPTPGVVANLCRLCAELLEPLRMAYGAPIFVNSGYRSIAVNRAVGGAPASAHLSGLAADITAGSPLENEALFDLARSLGLRYDQLIDEYHYQWIHIALSAYRAPRLQTLHLPRRHD